MEKTREELITIAKETGKRFKEGCDGAHNFFVVYQDGTISDFKQGQACYSSLEYGVVRKTPALFVAWSSGDKIKPSLHRLSYFNWVMNHSPYAPCFITKKASDVYNQPVILSCDFSPQLVVCAATLIRYRVEFPEMIDTWIRLKRFMSKELALVLIHFLRIEGKSVSFSPGGNNNHWVLKSSEFGKTRLKNFLNDTKVNLTRLLSKGNYSYRNFNDIWGPFDEMVFPGYKDYHTVTDCWGNQKKYPTVLTKNLRKFSQEFLKLNGVVDA